MDNWKKLHEATLPEKEQFCSNLNMEDIKDAGYMHAKHVCKDFDTLLFPNIFQNFRQLFLKISHLDPVKCLPASRLESFIANSFKEG